MNAIDTVNPVPSAGYPFDAPEIDRRLDEVSDSSKNHVSEIANALWDRGIPPTPEQVAAVMRRLNLVPLEREVLAALLMRHWWTILDDIEPDDLHALDAHLARAPVREHPCCYYLKGFIDGVGAGQYHGFGDGYHTALRWG